MRPILTAICLMLPLAGPAAADSRHDDGLGDAGREIAQGLERIREGLAQLLEEIPRFAPPEITEEGDIILRRTNPPANPPGGLPPREDRDAPPPLNRQGAIGI
jgi:hypothetical protein